MKKIALDELPKYSPWIKRMLGMEEFSEKYKTPKEIMREYNDEKWKQTLQFLEEHPDSNLQHLEQMLFNKSEAMLFYNEKEVLLQTYFECKKIQINQYLSILKPYIKEMDAITELGAGYGAIILSLIKMLKNDRLKYFAAEYAPNGIKTLKKLAENSDTKINVGYCDFFSLEKDLDFSNVSKNMVFTSYALMYIPALKEDFINYIRSMNAKICIHFEPCYEHYEEDSLHGILCKKYMKINGYNKNLISLLKNAEKFGEIEIIKEDKVVFGINPLMPISIIVWKFCR